MSEQERTFFEKYARGGNTSDQAFNNTTTYTETTRLQGGQTYNTSKTLQHFYNFRKYINLFYD